VTFLGGLGPLLKELTGCVSESLYRRARKNPWQRVTISDYKDKLQNTIGGGSYLGVVFETIRQTLLEPSRGRPRMLSPFHQPLALASQPPQLCRLPGQAHTNECQRFRRAGPFEPAGSVDISQTQVERVLTLHTWTCWSSIALISGIENNQRIFWGRLESRLCAQTKLSAMPLFNRTAGSNPLALAGAPIPTQSIPDVIFSHGSVLD
jgi:hypothetical protein